jgi:tetratricopeptide (TPR) repeat protein
MEIENDLYKELLEQSPSPDTCMIVLSKMKEAGELKTVIHECHKVLRMYPWDIRTRQLLAETYIEAGFLSLAEEELEHIAARIDRLSKSFKVQAEVYSRQGRREEAIQALDRYLAHQPQDEEATQFRTRLAPTESVDSFIEPNLDEPPIANIEMSPVNAFVPMDEDSPLGGPPTAEGLQVPEDPNLLKKPYSLEELSLEDRLSLMEEAGLMKAPSTEDDQDSSDESLDPHHEDSADEEAGDIATPTLAEVYYRQGQLEEAIKTYKQVLQQNPTDLDSENRLAELVAESYRTTLDEKAEGDRKKTMKTERLIAVLETWRSLLIERSDDLFSSTESPKIS